MASSNVRLKADSKTAEVLAVSGQDSPENSARSQKKIFVPKYEPIQTRLKADSVHESEAAKVPSVLVQDSPDRVTRGQKRVFVPKYEPIQTRKRAKLSHETVPLHSSSVDSHITMKETGRKMPRTRLTKDEVFMPDVGPRPRAVPKSLLILEPELLPRHLKKKQMQTVSSVQVHTSAIVNKDQPICWTAADQADQSHSISTVTLPVSGNASLLAVSSPQLLESAGEKVSLERKEESRTGQSEDDSASYILSTVTGDEGTGNFIAVGNGCIAAVEPVGDTDEGQNMSYAVISETSGDLGEERSNTPTSLLLLAEAAYPSTAGPPAPAVVTSVTQSSPQNALSSATGTAHSQARKVCLSQNRSISTTPTFITVSCDRGSSTIVSTSSEGPTPSSTSSTPLLPGRWTCTVCGELMKESEREQHLTQHLDTVEEEDFICETCGEQLKDEEDLELHMAVEHDDEEEEDDVEGMEDFEDEEDDNSKETEERMEQITETITGATLSTAAGNPVYTCEQCEETFQYAAYLRRHVKTAHTDTGAVFTCSMCPRTFTSESALEMHSCLHQKPGVSFKCIRCSQSFSSASLLSSHARSCLRVAIHTPNIIPKRSRGRGRGQSRTRASDHACSVCNKTFTSEVYLKAHQLSHQTGVDTANSFQRNRGLQCLYCEEKFYHLGPLKEHMLAQHPNAFPFKCSICQRGFSRDSSRIAHEQTHQTLKLHFCSECGEGFTLQTYLNRHMKYRHLKPVKFPCSVCQKEFVRQADLIKHMRVHTGEKPYSCEQCGHGFSQQSNYRYHMMRHRGEKPHVCPMCQKGFRVPSHLKMHMQQHLNERFTCQYCHKVFSQSRYLNRHLRTHSKGKQMKAVEQTMPAAITAATPQATETVVVYENPAVQPVRTEQQVIVDSVGDISEHVVVQESGEAGESVIQFVMQDRETTDSEGDAKEVSIVDAEGNTILTTTVGTTSDAHNNVVQVAASEGSQAEVTEEQAYVNADEGTRVVRGAFSEGEGGSMEDGKVTLPFRDLTQLLGGKHYKCDVCSESFSIRPNSMYNMIHTGQSHILVINLNDCQTHSHADS